MIKPYYCVAVGMDPISHFKQFALGNWIGTQGAGPSAYGGRQFSSYEEAKEAFNLLTTHSRQVYNPILGVTDDGSSRYLDIRKNSDLIWYCGLPNWDWWIGNYTINSLESMGCLDFC